MESQNQPVCVIDIIGDEGVGKSTLKEKWLKSSVYEELSRMLTVHVNEIKCQDWLPGPGQLVADSKFVFHGFYLVYDSTAPDTLDSVLDCSERIAQRARRNRKITTTPVIFLIANKDDLEEEQFQLGESKDVESRMEAISRWESTCVTASTEFSFARLISQMLSLELIQKMLGQACFHDYLNLVKILFLQMEEGEFANKEYAVQAFKGASQRQLIKKVPLAVEQKRRSLPIHTKPRLPSRPVHSIAASPSGVFTEHSQSCSDDFGSGACTSPVAGDMDVLSYLLSLNTNDVMKMLASEAVTDPRLYGRLLHQYFPWQGSSMVKWRCLGLQILQPAWITGCVGLTAVHLSHNELKAVPVELFQISTVKTLNLSDNQLCSLPAAYEWRCDSLSSLDLSDNMLKGNEGGSVVQPSKEFPNRDRRKISVAREHYRTGSVGSRKSLAQTVGRLFKVSFRGNSLAMLPPWLFELPTLGILDIRGTPLTHLPKELANCQSLLTLKLDKDRFTYPRKRILEEGLKSIKAYLYNQLYHTVAYHHMGLIVLGNAGMGKSLLINWLHDPSKMKSKLKTSKASSSRLKTSIKSCQFSLKPKGAKHEIDFHVVDFAGEKVFLSTNQCFMSDRAVYFAVWSVNNGQRGLLDLRPWLFSIQARAPSAPVVLIGTHCDDLSPSSLAALEEMVQSVYPYYDGQSMLQAKGLPAIADSLYVSLHQTAAKSGVWELRERLYEIALTVKSPASMSRKSEPYLKQQVPKSYTIFQEVVAEKARELQGKQLPAMIEVQELYDLAREANCQIDDLDDFFQACGFLHEVGVLLHFPNAHSDLQEYVFIDPQWLYDTIATIIRVDPEANDSLSRKRRKGVLRARWLPQILNRRMADVCYKMLLHVLEHFHIIVALNSERSSFLVPALLPAKAPRSGAFGFKRSSRTRSLDDNSDQELHLPLSEAILRTYELSYVPGSFWSKVISALVVLFTERKHSDGRGLGGQFQISQSGRSELGDPVGNDEVDGKTTLSTSSNSGVDIRVDLPSPCPENAGDVFTESSTATVGDFADGAIVQWLKAPDAAQRKSTAGDLDDRSDTSSLVDSMGDLEASGNELCWEAGGDAFEVPSYVPNADEPDGSLTRTLSNAMKKSFTRRRSSDLLSSFSMLDPAEDFVKLDHPDGGFIPSGCSCSSGNDSASVVEAMSMIGSITSVAGGQHESHEYRKRNDVEASQYLLTLLQCAKNAKSDTYDITADDVHLVIRAWQTGVAVHISMPDYPLAASSLRPTRMMSESEKFVEVRLEQLPGAECGLQIAVWGHPKLQSCLLAQATYLTDSILEDWYPGLYDKVRRWVPCPKCIKERIVMTDSDRYQPSQVHNFDLDRLIAAASRTGAVRPPHCKDHGAIEMKTLAPDVLLSDLPSDILLEAEDFDNGLELTEDDKLGDGGYAQVYKTKLNGRTVAVKLFTKKVDSRTLPYQELRTEVSALDQLTHRNVVKMIGACRQPVCLVLELAPLSSMSSVLRKIYKAGVPLHIAHVALTQIASALDYLHKLRIIYRDLKPQNVLVWSLEPGNVLVKLADYGIATFALPAGIRDPQGTKGYMAPEVSAKSHVPYTEKADIYSLGVVIFEVVSGRKPYWEKPASFNAIEAQKAGIIPDLNEAVLASATASSPIGLAQSLSVPSVFGESEDMTPPARSPMKGARQDDISLTSLADNIDSDDEDTVPVQAQSPQKLTPNIGRGFRKRYNRFPSLPGPSTFGSTSTPLRRRTTEKMLKLDHAKALPSSFCRTHWLNTHLDVNPEETKLDGDMASVNKAPPCISTCFQYLVDRCLHPSPTERPSARQVVSHLATCCCFPAPCNIEVKPQHANQRLLLCVTAVRSDSAQDSVGGSSSDSGLPFDLSLSPIRPGRVVPSHLTESNEEADCGADQVDGVGRSHHKVNKLAVSTKMSRNTFQESSPSTPRHADLSRKVKSSPTFRRKAIVQRQDTFNDLNSSTSGSIYNTAPSNLTILASPDPVSPTRAEYAQYACVCCNDRVQTVNCFTADSQVKSCTDDGDEITAACCVGCDEIWLGTAGGLVFVHSLPNLRRLATNAPVPAAVTYMTTLRSNNGLSILPAKDVLVGSNDGQLARFYTQGGLFLTVKAVPQFIRRVSPQEDNGPITCISHANIRNEFAVIAGGQHLLVYDCVRWEEKTHVDLELPSDKPVSQVAISDHGLWLFTEQSSDVLLVDLDDGGILTHLCGRCEVLQALNLPLFVPEKRNSAALFAPRYLHIASITMTSNTLWVLLTSGILMAFDVDDMGSPVLLSCRQAHQGPGMLFSLDTRSALSIGMLLESSTWLSLIREDSDLLPSATKEQLGLLQWEVQEIKQEKGKSKHHR